VAEQKSIPVRRSIIAATIVNWTEGVDGGTSAKISLSSERFPWKSA